MRKNTPAGFWRVISPATGVSPLSERTPARSPLAGLFTVATACADWENAGTRDEDAEKEIEIERDRETVDDAYALGFLNTNTGSYFSNAPLTVTVWGCFFAFRNDGCRLIASL